jgi:hypothetical protein
MTYIAPPTSPRLARQIPFKPYIEAVVFSLGSDDMHRPARFGDAPSPLFLS